MWAAEHGGQADDSDEERAELGKGAFAVTLRMRNEEGLLVAAKRFLQRDMKRAGLTPEKVHKEAETLRGLQHQHVVRYLGTVSTRKHLFLVMELAAGGPLAARVRLLPPPENVLLWGRQLASALEYVHWRGVVHRDLKNDNVLLTDQARLADWTQTDFASRIRNFVPFPAAVNRVNE